MISFIKGEIVQSKNGIIVLENNGIGYEMSVSSTTIAKMNAQSNEAKLYTYLNVKEDCVILYGFHSIEEKNMFLKLISISGVGPKAAMSILSGIELTSLVTAIVTKDLKTLSKVKGIGKKTAERIVLELKESIAKEDIENADIDFISNMTDIMDQDSLDAVLALRGLGIAQKEAVNAVSKAKSSATNIEDLIAKALKNL